MTSSTPPDPAKAAFPGGSAAPDPGELRIAVDKKPYADIIGHAVLEPEVEVCGVLVGRLLKDAQGEFLHVTGVIRGEAAKQQGAQVTFTHETWNHIHSEMDKHHANEQIVGWYHTHGGFGIFLSDMDSFIHKNFFSASYQVAYVFDPLAGTEGFFQAKGDELELARRFWVGGRERKVVAHAPEPAVPAPGAPGGAARADLAGATHALQRCAAALEASTARSGEGLPLNWSLFGVVGLFIGWYLLTGQSPLSRGEPQVSRSQALLLLQRDASSGRALGVELLEVQSQDGPVYRDGSGHLYLGVELHSPNGAPNALQKLLGSAAPAQILLPPASPGALPEPPAGRGRWSVPRWVLVTGAVAIAVVVVAAGAAYLWMLRKRRPAARAK
ncbi:MAG: Mov34/MPN/PAD-1 family protein [Deltaproteobacteria bacterium]|nr:Mov34/MPN/PAD-1 family protein [Deltaproteobacteria bacterium]